MMNKILLTKFLLLVGLCATAQERQITGRVTSADDNTPVPGVNVVVKGTPSGTVTDSNGTYSLMVPNDNATLVFSFIGLRSQEIVIGGRSIVDVAMALDVTQLGEVVVTAQGIERDKRSLGYALTAIDGASVAQRSEPNVLNALQGKLAGVNITGASGGAGASTNINIRGIASFSGSNQPLIVVDGVIFNNSVNNSQNTLFGTQPSNRLLDISPESIESINVLKGPAASVLYGSRASNGVIVITTKRGGSSGGSKMDMTLSSSVNFQNVTGFPELQNKFGQGANNDFNAESSNSWGPAFGGALTEVTTAQGELVPYQAYPNNVTDFFQTGRIIQNALNINAGDKDRNISAALSSTFQDGIIPGTKYVRNSFQLAGNTLLTKGLKLSSSFTYVNSKNDGTVQGNAGSSLGQITRIPRSYDLMGMPFEDANGQSIYYNNTQNHPLWSTKYETMKSSVDRVFGFVTLGYDLTSWLNVSYRGTADVYYDVRQIYNAIGSARNPTGQIQESFFYNSELNGDLLITASKDDVFLPGLSASLLLGQNINQRKFQNTVADATTLTIPGYLNLSNGSIFTGTGDSKTLRRLVGGYADLNLNFKDYLFLELQGRVDKSSTLPSDNNAFFYPAASMSFVPSEAFDIKTNIFNYAKVRASIARVGLDANPYVTSSVFVSSGQGNNVASVTFPISVGGVSIPGFQPGSRIGSNALTPEFTTSWEVGANLELFNNKLRVDVGYFSSSSTAQILNVAISNSSGFDTQTSNVGEMINKGWEVELSATALKRGDFSWEIAGNWTRIRNRVESIIEGVQSSGIAGNSFIGISPSFREGSPYGVIIGTAYATNDQGQRLVNPATGLYMPGIPNSVIADPNREWSAGLTNTFRYKGFTLYSLLDVKYGGDLYSFSWTDLRSNGSLAITGEDRDQPRILPGVIDNGDGTYSDNFIQISAQSYWAGLGGLASEAAVFDATVVRLRELALSYELPQKLLAKTPFRSANIGVSGRNLWFHAPNAPGDPEVNSQGAGNIQGLDLNGAPNTRNYGVNLRITL